MLGSAAIVRRDVVGGVIVVGANVGVRPLGAVAVRSTGLLKPPIVLRVIVDVLESPGVSSSEAGLGVTVKSGPTTVTVTEVSLKRYPLAEGLLPNMSTLYEPGMVELTLNVAVEPLVTLAGAIDAFRFCGGETKRSTDPEKPLVGTTVMVEL